MGGGGEGSWSPRDPPLYPPLRVECGELILFVFLSWYAAIETPSAPTKAAAPVAATRQDVYAGKWEPNITNSRNCQISFVHSVFIKLAALLLHELFLQCYDEEEVLFLESFWKYNERSSSRCPNLSPLQSFSLRPWVTKGNRKIVFSVCAKFLLAKLEHFSVGVKFCLLVYLFVFFHITC